HTGQPLSKIAVKKTVNTTYDEFTDKNITEVDVEKEFYSTGQLKRERVITRKIAERITRRKNVIESVKITFSNYIEQNRKVIEGKIEELDDPVLNEFSKQVADMLKRHEFDMNEVLEITADLVMSKCCE